MKVSIFLSIRKFYERTSEESEKVSSKKNLEAKVMSDNSCSMNVFKTFLTSVLFQHVVDSTNTYIHFHIFMFCSTNFFSNQIQIDQFEKKSFGQNMNIRIYTPHPN